MALICKSIKNYCGTINIYRKKLCKHTSNNVIQKTLGKYFFNVNLMKSKDVDIDSTRLPATYLLTLTLKISKWYRSEIETTCYDM